MTDKPIPPGLRFLPPLSNNRDRGPRPGMMYVPFDLSRETEVESPAASTPAQQGDGVPPGRSTATHANRIMRITRDPVISPHEEPTRPLSAVPPAAPIVAQPTPPPASAPAAKPNEPSDGVGGERPADAVAEAPFTPDRLQDAESEMSSPFEDVDGHAGHQSPPMTRGKHAKGEPYEVGYGKPPKEHQFRKGEKSPNEKGRPKQELSLAAEVRRLASETVTIIEHGKKTECSKLQAFFKQLWARVAGGDAKAQELLYKMFTSYLPGEVAPDHRQTATEDAALLAKYLKRGNLT